MQQRDDTQIDDSVTEKKWKMEMMQMTQHGSKEGGEVKVTNRKINS